MPDSLGNHLHQPAAQRFRHLISELMKTKYRILIGITIAGVLMILPVRIYLAHTTPSDGALGHIYFGEKFQESALPEVQSLHLDDLTRSGYDGQFYAQIALRPSLKDLALLRALDNPSYRARRIGLPFTAYWLGMGKPAWILQIYSVLNYAFWLLLLGVLYRFVGFSRPRDVLLAVSLLWTTGTLASVVRALPDLPATVLMVLAVFTSSGWIASALFLSTASLFRETSVLCLAAVPLREDEPWWDARRLAKASFIIIVPIALWLLYVHFRTPTRMETDYGQFSFPFVGLLKKFGLSAHNLIAEWDNVRPLRRGRLLFELLCPISLFIQATYLATKPRLNSQLWRMGIGFVLLLSVVGDQIWVAEHAYTRILLPLTFAFNLLIHKHEFGGRFVAWYLLGNGGMGFLIFRFLR